MKFLASQFAYLLSNQETRGNLRALVKYVLFLGAMVTVYAVIFHVITTQIEGHEHSWITGFYWVLVVMTTLGLGDITLTSDIGRLFSIVVLLSGVVFLLVMLPFLFIRLFYAPWLEARMRLRAPRELPAASAGHVIVTEYDDVGAALVARLRAERLPYVVIEPDPATAARMVGEGLTVVSGEIDSRATYERIVAGSARLLLANRADTVNTNITLTAREAAPHLPIASVIETEDAGDVLTLSGASWVLPLKRQLGEYLAARVDTGRPEAHVIGRFGDLRIAELPARDTAFTGLTVRYTRLRERFGVSVVGLWQRGQLKPAYPDTVIPADSVLVLAGTAAVFDALHERHVSGLATAADSVPGARGADGAHGAQAPHGAHGGHGAHGTAADAAVAYGGAATGPTGAAPLPAPAATAQNAAARSVADAQPSAVLVIGAGNVGHAAARALARTHVPVHVIDRSAKTLRPLRDVVTRTFVGDAADRTLLMRAGITHAPSVLMTTNDDAMNIYLTVFCRKLNPEVRIVSRITHERNVEAIHRAGADFAISYTSLGVEAVMALLQQHEPVLLGEGVQLFTVPVPASLAEGTLGQSGIGSKTGLSVVALARDGQVTAPLTSETLLPTGADLLMLGSLEQRRQFGEAFER